MNKKYTKTNASKIYIEKIFVLENDYAPKYPVCFKS